MTTSTQKSAVNALLSCSVVFALVAFANSAVAASSSISNLDIELSAKVARERITQNKEELEFKRENRSFRQHDCGSVNIGNDYDDGEPTARERLNPRQRVIVITAPVINAANCR